ncbi:MAG: hypothetical protein IPH45_14695 [Bacteroidales bacterium]|nr:hypothetical protein [Bacteroidales bacterium]
MILFTLYNCLVNKALLTEDPRNIANSLQKLGRYFILKEDYSISIKCYLQSLRIEEKRNNPKGMADLFDELGIIYYYQEIFENH